MVHRRRVPNEGISDVDRRSLPGVLRRRGAAVLALVALLVLATACDPFYRPPSPLPKGRPGDVIRSRPSVFTMDPVAKTPVPGVRSTQILYRSQDARGQAIAVSGTVLVPTAPWAGAGKRPLVTFAVGTRGLGDACAPSKTLANGTDFEAGIINSFLSRGWAVVVTDYEGLGTPGIHTYVVGRTEGRSVLDAARAAQRLAGSGLDATTPVGVYGYSQGGGAAAWAGELAASYAPELNLKGVVEGGVPADLPAVASSVDGGPAVALALFASVGFDAAYPELDLERYLTTRGRDFVARAGSACLTDYQDSVFPGTAFTHLDDYASPNPLTIPAWQARFAQNKLGSTAPSVPVFQFHGTIDELVPYGQADALHRTYCQAGVNLTWVPLPLQTHLSAPVAAVPLATNFLADRFAGIPAVRRC